MPVEGGTNAQTSKIDRIEGPGEVMLGSAALFRAIGTGPGLSKEQQAKVEWRLQLPGGSFRRLDRGGSVARSINGELGSATIVAELAKQKVSHSFSIVDAKWPELDASWALESEMLRERSVTVLARFKSKAGAQTPLFIVGKEVPHSNRRGLTLSGEPPTFSAATYAKVKTIGHWAYVIEPTCKVEGSASFAALNTYDKANFSFGLIQFSAMNYDANLQRLIVKLFGDPETKAAAFMPGLTVQGKELYDRTGKVCLTSADRPENDELRRYLKPKNAEVTATEIEFAARFVYWTRFFLKSHHHQVQLAIDDQHTKIRALDRGLEHSVLDGKSDRAFCWLFDMYVHGAPARTEIRAALGHKEPEKVEKALFELKKKKHPERAERLKKWIADHPAPFGLVYDADKKTFKSKD